MAIHIALTGATGFIGRHLLFEIVKQNLSRLNDLKVFVLGRNSAKQNLAKRLIELFDEEAWTYLNVPKFFEKDIRNWLQTNLIGVEIDLKSEKLIDQENLRKIQSVPLDFFVHLAAVPNLQTTQKVAQETYEANVGGTRKIVQLLQNLNFGEFDYVGTAYVCGTTAGRIFPNYQNLSQEFRNPYEKSKLEAELLIGESAEKYHWAYRCFRPAVVCGRLLEKPYGHTSKFDVFYTLFAFLFWEKYKKLGSLKAVFEEETDLPLRAVFDWHNESNLVPVDYVVKTLYQVLVQKPADRYFHLVNPQNMIFGEFWKGASKALKISGIEAVSEVPADMNLRERLYYANAGTLLRGYMFSEPVYFDDSNLRKILEKADLKCPPIDANQAYTLIRYAMERNFGLDLGK